MKDFKGQLVTWMKNNDVKNNVETFIYDDSEGYEWIAGIVTGEHGEGEFYMFWTLNLSITIILVLILQCLREKECDWVLIN